MGDSLADVKQAEVGPSAMDGSRWVGEYPVRNSPAKAKMYSQHAHSPGGVACSPDTACRKAGLNGEDLSPLSTDHFRPPSRSARAARIVPKQSDPRARSTVPRKRSPGLKDG
jgi:hypothetical protein